MTYAYLEDLRSNWGGKVCLFGAGYIGKTWGYDLVCAAGFKVDFFCDNNIASGTKVRGDIEVVDIQYLISERDRTLVFLTVSHQIQKVITEQLRKNGIFRVINIDRVSLAEILDSIDISGEAVKQRYHAVYNDIEFLEKKFEYKTGYKLNIGNPKTFNEKLQWLKVYNHKSEYTQLVDKYLVKQFVEERIGGKYIIPTLGVWRTFDEIDFSELPEQFVLKCTHDSGSIVIVDDVNRFDKKEAEKRLTEALKINYFWMGREWPYKNVERRIIAEKYIAEAREMIDYKFLCFNGKVRSIFTCSDRFSGDGLKVTFFDKEWKRLPFERHYPASKRKIVKPAHFHLMIELAEKLSAGIPFVRIDLYDIEEKIYFGEMTFFPGGGMEEFSPEKWDRTMGDWIVLPEVNDLKEEL